MTYCGPIVDCCCQPWSIAQGETKPLIIDWSPWLARSPNFVGINEIVEASLLNLNVPPPHPPAAPDEIAIVSSFATDPPIPPANPGWTIVYNGNVTETLIEARAALVGRVYRFNMKVRANDCNGRRITTLDCYFITITQC